MARFIWDRFCPVFTPYSGPGPSTSGPRVIPGPPSETMPPTTGRGVTGISIPWTRMTVPSVWTWDPRGCGVTNIPPVTNGKVFIEADTATDYHYGYFATLDAETPGQRRGTWVQYPWPREEHRPSRVMSFTHRVETVPSGH